MTVLYEKKIPVTERCDVLVAGGGPAGICAAVAAAREGCRVALLERYGALGGNLTLGLVGHTMGRVAPGAMTDEINALIGGDSANSRAQDFEQAKIELTRLIREAGVRLYLQSAAADTVCEDGAVLGVIAATPEGMRAFEAAVTVDATGDGQIACLAGATFQKGRPEDGLQQPVTLMFKMGGVDDGRAITQGNRTYDVRMPDSGFRDFCVQAARRGELPAAASFVRLYRTMRAGECVVNTTQYNGADGTSLSDITAAEYELREQIPVIIRFLQKNVAGFENCFLQESAATLGVRETRRILGQYVLHEDDLFAGRRFEDAVVHNAYFPIDIHNPTGAGMKEFTKVQPYDIPYRCLVPAETERLLTAGRCISATHRAQASCRVMNICMAVGQAAGIAAAAAVQTGIAPSRLRYQEVQQRLLTAGAVLFD